MKERKEAIISAEQHHAEMEMEFIELVKEACRHPEVRSFIADNDIESFYDSSIASADRRHIGDYQFYYRWEKRGNMIVFDISSIRRSDGKLFANHLLISRKLVVKALAKIKLAVEKGI